MYLSIVTLNILGDPGKKRADNRLPLLLDQVAALKPDVALLQELAWPGEQATSIATRLSLTSGMPYVAWVVELAATNGWSEGLGIVTHLPVTSHETLRYPDADVFCHRVHIAIGTRSVAIHNCHLDPFDQERRAGQVAMMAAWSDGLDITVLGGDFNTEPNDPEIEPIRRQYTSAFAAANGTEPSATVPTPLCPDHQPKVVDYLWLARPLVATQATLTFDTPSPNDSTLYASDHYGVFATLEVR
jgi:endonuclease/exonuclease/phosphatase family metal-dependent hydrolase